MTKIRTRIAPSPTGDPHVGTAYIALFNRCFAHSQQGKFILRIEDTDQARSSIRSEQDIFSSLRWLGLDWDEGPDKGGNFGPYRQSERIDIYEAHVNQLLERGLAFRCFCSSERLDTLRKQQLANRQTPGYDGHCLSLSEAEVQEKLAAGEKYVVRMKVPESGNCVFKDLLRGEVSIAWSQVDMQVLMKSDGLPTYHLANVVDDHLMGITHVIRGEEWINSVPKHVLLYEYFGWNPPIFCHMPLLRNPDKSKLSKRKNPTSINYYRDMGYLPATMVNYLGMMGWSMPQGEEVFNLNQMTQAFDISRVSLGGPIFDIGKLDWLNGVYLREQLSEAEFAKLFMQWASAGGRLHKVIPQIRQRVDKFSDIADLAGFFLSGIVQLDAEQFAHKSLEQAQLVKILQFSLWRLESLQDWNRDTIEECLQSLSRSMELKIRDFLFPLFVVISGRAVSTSVFDSVAILGIDISRARIRHGIEVLGGVSKKAAKRLEHDYRILN